MSMHTRPAQVKSQDRAISEFDGTDCVICVPSFCEFGMTGILSCCEDSVDLSVWGWGVGYVEEPAGYVDIVDSWMLAGVVYIIGSSRQGEARVWVDMMKLDVLQRKMDVW
jgi:hypothetical protein